MKLRLRHAFSIACLMGLAACNGEQNPDDAAVVSMSAPAEEAAAKEDVTAKFYTEAVYYGRSEESQIWLDELRNEGRAEADIQKILNDAFLNAAAVAPSIGNFTLALENGANANATDAKGHDAVAIMLREGKYEAFGMLQWLSANSAYDTRRLRGMDDLLFAQFADRVLAQPYAQSMTVDDLLFLKTTGYDLSRLQDSTTGTNLLHLAAANGAVTLIGFIAAEKLRFSQHDKLGNDVFTIAANDETRAALRDKLFLRPQAAPQPSSAALQNIYRAYLAKFERRAPGIFKGSIDPADFAMYAPLRTPALPDNGVNPALIVAEYAPLSDITSRMMGNRPHIIDTTRSAIGTGLRLGSAGAPPVFSVAESTGAFNGNALSRLLSANRSDYVIVSHSVGDTGDIKQYNKDPLKFMPEQLRKQDARSFVQYNSAGNAGQDTCLTHDGYKFCLQDSGDFYHGVNIVRVGAAERQADGSYMIASYSQNRPAFCAPVPLEENGKPYKGTSFSAPAAAAVERKLADIFARSSRLPYGHTHEDIFMALMLTARTQGLTDEADGKAIRVTYNAAGVAQTERCGTGVIDPQAAANLLTEMAQWNKDGTTRATVANTMQLSAVPDTKPERHGRNFVYRLTMPRDGVMLSLRAALPFFDGQNGAVRLKVGAAAPLTLDMSGSGLSTEYRLAGLRFNKGTRIEIETTRKLGDDYQADKPYMLDIRYVQTDSALAHAVARNAAKALQKPAV